MRLVYSSVLSCSSLDPFFNPLIDVLWKSTRVGPEDEVNSPTDPKFDVL
jgi:hypothetical protein